MPLTYPPGYQSTSTKEKLSNKPSDMPDRGGPKPFCQTTSSRTPLGRSENPVAAAGAHPGMGSVQSTSTRSAIGKSATSPYGPIGATKPQVNLPGRGKKK